VSLRTRLIAGLLALATIGLVVLAGVTYAEQRSFLLTRVDQQARTALGPIDRALDLRGIGAPPGGFGDGLRGPRPGGGTDGPGAPGVDLPPGTYGQRRTASGKVLGSVALSYGQTTLPKPRLPQDMPLGQVTTVGSVGKSGVHFRALASPSFGGTTIVAVPMREVEQTLHRLLLVEALVIAGVLMGLAGVAYFVVRLGLRPLERMGETAGAIAAGDLSRRVSPAEERTEVGRLGLALNRMLARLERAFAERRASEESLRRFLADASHELRTPLASIRGYSELFRTGAARDGENTEKAMRRIEEEAARMGVLVEDLLTLARLEEQRPVAHDPVDLAAIVTDAADDARVTDRGRSVEVDAPGPAVMAGDAHQLRQLVGNLVRNALVHTPAGTPLELSLQRQNGELLLNVRDHGPGLPGDDPDVLFERFWRAESGRERGKGGAGLGLAIVARVAEAHGGDVSAKNAPDGGARFRVRLPVGAVSAAAPGTAPASASAGAAREGAKNGATR
jgi:two-component system, OmpR family, sensor kinase